MRSSLLVGLAIVALLLLTGPYYCGSRVADWHAQWSAQELPGSLPGLPPGWLVQASSLQSGYFTSRLQLELQPPVRLCPWQDCETIKAHTRIYHGPLALMAATAPEALQPAWAIAVTRMDITPLLARRLPDPPLPPLRVVTHIGWTGKISSRFDLAGGSHVLRNGTQIDHQGMSGRLLNQATGDYALQLPSVSLASSRGETFGFQQLNVKQTQGVRLWQLEQLTVIRPDAALLDLSNLSLEVLAAPVAETGLVNAEVDVQLDRLTQGEQYSVGPIRFQLRAERLAVEALMQLPPRLWAVYSRTLPAELEQASIRGLWLGLLPRLAQFEPRIVINDFSLGRDPERLRAGLDLRLSALKTRSSDMKAFLRAVDLTTHVDLPSGLTQSVAAWQAARVPGATANQQLKDWQSNGWLVNNGSRYRASLRLADARLTVNGNASKEWAAWIAAQQDQKASLRNEAAGNYESVGRHGGQGR